MQCLQGIGESQCVCRKGAYAHVLTLTSLTLFVAAWCLSRRAAFRTLAKVVCALGVTSVLYHATHPPCGWSMWRCVDVPMCYLVGVCTLYYSATLPVTCTWWASMGCFALAGTLAAQPQYTLCEHGTMHVALSAGLVALSMCGKG